MCLAARSLCVFPVACVRRYIHVHVHVVAAERLFVVTVMFCMPSQYREGLIVHVIL